MIADEIKNIWRVWCIAILLVSGGGAVLGDDHSITFRFCGADGNSLPGIEGSYICDLNYNPVVKFEAGKQVQTIKNLPGIPILISMFMTVPHFGTLNFTAANGGKGFVATGQTVDVVYEVAKHRYIAAARVLESASRAGYVFPKTISMPLEEANNLLVRAGECPGGSGQQARLALLSLEKSAPAAEELVIELGRQKLDRQNGIRHGQLISTFSYYENGQERQIWSTRLAPLFNCGVDFWHWNQMLKGDGTPNYEYIRARRETVDRLYADGKILRGHAFMWLNGTPKWMKDVSYENVESALLKSTQILLKEYPQVKYWLLANEPSGSWDNLEIFSPSDIVRLIDKLARQCGSIAPDVKRGVNTVMLWGDDAASHLKDKPQVVGEFRFHQMLNEANVPYEFIGMQIYFNGRDIFEVDQMLEMWRTLGKRIHICESCAPSSGALMPGNPHFPNGHPGQIRYRWHRAWDPKLQADWLEGMFLICLSKEYVDEWNWWDRADFGDVYYPWGGLLDAKGDPKPSWERLEGLIKKWGCK